MIMSDSTKDILILGNGFDLSCRLASTYGDFFQKRYSEEFLKYFEFKSFLSMNIPSPKDLPEIMEKYGLLDCLLVANTKQIDIKKYDWADIESILLDFFQDSSLNLTSLVKQYADIKNQNKRYVPNFLSNFNKQEKLLNYRSYEDEFPNKYKLEIILEMIGYKHDIRYNMISENDIKKVLLFEFKRSLTNLEKDFQTYLQREVEAENSSYLTNTYKLFNALELDEPNTYLITFNYTRRDTLASKNYERNFYEENNVHGQIGTSREIIFGIDENNIDTDSEYYPFTKTYRKLILDSKRAQPYEKLPNIVKNIIFYGHSLSDADYAYFYSIFDFYSIYNSDINIIFYYYNYIGGNSDKVLNTYTSSIARLFNSYSKNSNFTTKNLLHKLNLEGRIHIKEIKIKYDEDTTKIIDAEII